MGKQSNQAKNLNFKKSVQNTNPTENSRTNWSQAESKQTNWSETEREGGKNDSCEKGVGASVPRQRQHYLIDRSCANEITQIN